MDILEFLGRIVAMIFVWLIFAGCIRRWGSHTLINGFMSKEKADAVFPGWRSKGNKEKTGKEDQ